MNIKEKQALIDQHGTHYLTQLLAPYISSERKTRINDVIAARLNSIELAIENPYDIHNALAAVRSSECFGVSTVHIIAPSNEAVGIRPITKGSSYWTHIVIHDNLMDFLQNIQSRNIALYGGALQSTTTTVSKIPIENPLCIFIGNEHHGLSNDAKSACNALYKIPLYGMSESLNLSVSAAISLFNTTTRKRQWLQQNSDLTPEQANAFKAEYYITSVSERLFRGLIKRQVKS